MSDDEIELSDADGPMVEAMLSSVVDGLCEQVDHTEWDSPPRLLLLQMDPVEHTDDDGDQMGFEWRICGQAELVGHPFHALFGQQLDDELVGIVLVAEGWTRAKGSTLLDAELRLCARDDGQCEIRNLYALLRDGSWVQAVQPRGGSWHRIEGQPSGRVPAAMSLLLGRASGLQADAPHELASRAWRWMALSVLNNVMADMDTNDVPEAALGELGEALREAGIVDEDEELPRTIVGDAVIANLGANAGYADSLPGPISWLVRQAAGSWQEALDEARRAGICDGAVQWLLESGDSRVKFQGCDEAWEANALRWCDAGMLGNLFDAVVPDEEQIDELWHKLHAQGATSISLAELRRAADHVLRNVGE